MPNKNQATKLCYVIMPFSKTKICTEEEWTEIFDKIFKPAVEGAGRGYQCLRSEATTGNMISKIVNSLYHANVVIADLTDRNPNVFYELGVRHTLQNRTIMIAQRRKDIPSDLHGYASHVYKWKTTAQKGELTKKLRRLLEHIEQDTDRSDNPVSDFLREGSYTVLEFRREENSLKLRALILEFDRISTLLSAFLKRAKPKDTHVPGLRQPSPALDHLIATQYVNHARFNRHASGMRGILELLAEVEVPRQVCLEILSGVNRFKRNAEKILAAYEAGDAMDAREIEELPD